MYCFFSYDEEVIGDWSNRLVPQVRDGFFAGGNYPVGQQFIDKEYLSRIDFSKYEGQEVLEEEAGNYYATERIASGFLRSMPVRLVADKVNNLRAARLLTLRPQGY